MQAMILAAGLGTRMGALTASKPKALVEAAGKPLLQHTAEKLVRAGFTHLIINAHHFANDIVTFIESVNGFGVRTDISVEEKLLDTGGGIRYASRYFDNEPVLIYNVDIISGIDTRMLLGEAAETESDALLVVRARETNRYFLFNDAMSLCGWESVKPQKRIDIGASENAKRLAFSGIHVIAPNLFEDFPGEDAFSVVDWYLSTAKGGKRIRGFHDRDSDWFDVGTPEKLRVAEEYLRGASFSG